MTTLTLERFAYHPEGTLGSIMVGEQRFYSIERPWLDNAPNISCIPEGTYQTGWRDSPRFGETWHIQSVPGRTFILIHVANYPKDIQGCIGLGMSLMGDKIAVSSSRNAVKLFEDLTKDIGDWSLEVRQEAYGGL